MAPAPLARFKDLCLDVVALGASVLSAPEEFDWIVLADPDGNGFCVFAP